MKGKTRAPWVCLPSYIHPDALGRDAVVAGSWSTTYTLQSPATLELGLQPDEVGQAAADANVLVGLLSAASGPLGRMAFWGFRAGPSTDLMRILVDDLSVNEMLARLVGEDPIQFRRKIPERFRLLADPIRRDEQGFPRSFPAEHEILLGQLES